MPDQAAQGTVIKIYLVLFVYKNILSELLTLCTALSVKNHASVLSREYKDGIRLGGQFSLLFSINPFA